MNSFEWSYKLNSPYVKSLSKNVQRTMRNERSIINAIIKEALALGYFIQSKNSEGEYSDITKKKSAIEPILYACDDGWLRVLEPSPTVSGKYRKVCSFYFVYGNGNEGCDVMSDGSWIVNEERDTEEVFNALEEAGSKVSQKLELQI